MKKGCLAIAVAKGYLWNESKRIFNKMGFEFDTDLDQSRQLYTTDTTGAYRILLVRPWDVPTYVEEGAADLGIVGKDVLLEQSASVTEISDLKFGGCNLVLAGPKKINVTDISQNAKVATKFWNSTIHYFHTKGLNIHPIKLYGAIELAPFTEISDYICDLSVTGSTLNAHGLHIIDTIFESTARLIANTPIFSSKYDQIIEFNNALKASC